MSKLTKLQICVAVKTILLKVYPDFHVDIHRSHDDKYILCVRVFSVPEDKVREVKDVIHAMDDILCAETLYVLLPMVKTLAVTKEHYPEKLQPTKENDSDDIEVEKLPDPYGP